MWIVGLIKPIPILKNDYPEGYFPRKFRYKVDADELMRRVASKGGEAKVNREYK